MFTRIELSNFTTFAQLDWQDHAAMNVIIGENNTGKSHLLKLLYVFGRSISDYRRKKEGPRPISWVDSFDEKLLWTFQPNNLDNRHLIRNGENALDTMAWIGEHHLSYCVEGGFPTHPKYKGVTTTNFPSKNQVESTGFTERTVFLPPKEILTAMQAIEATRKRLEIAGFDDTYLDLIEDFRLPPTYGKIEPSLESILDQIKKILEGGEIIEKGMDYVFQHGDAVYSMAQTAEGFKKIGILSRLILNRSLTKGSILLVDEPEANLHPKAIVAMADILFDLSQAGIQVYAATHSFYFLSRIEQRARQAKSERVSLVDLRRSQYGVSASFHDLREGVPENPIDAQGEFLLNESIRLDWE